LQIGKTSIEAVKTKATDSHASHLEPEKKEDTIKKYVSVIEQQKEELAQTKQNYEEKLQKKEENLQKKDEVIASHLQMINGMKKEAKDYQSTIEKLNEKIKAYDTMHDESWISILEN